MENAGPGETEGLPAQRRRRALVAAGLAVGCGLLATYGRLWGSPGAFAAALDHGTRLFGDLHDVYLPMARAAWSEPVRPVANFFYSAFFALLLSPLGLQRPAAAAWAWAGLQIAALVALWGFPARVFLRGPAAVIGYAVLLLACQPVLHNFAWGQVSVLMCAGMLASAAALCAGRRRTAGLVLAAVSAIKYYPAVLLVCFLARRDARALAAFGVGLVTFWALIPAVALGPSDWLDFEARSLGALSRSGWVQGDINSQYFAHVAGRYLEIMGVTAPAATAWMAALVGLGAAVAAACAILAWRLQDRAGRRDTGLAVVALLLGLPFVLRTSWPHYFVYLPFCQVLLLQRLRQRAGGPWRSGALVATVLVSMTLASMAAFAAAGHWSAYSRLGLPFLASALLLPPLIGAVAAARSRTGRDAQGGMA